ncbi:MerR family transcriptional regulator [Mycolicibacterium hodleri]|uniref:MerR family transcriptional regulator n=1 Tax=Mycolicibacterium hodleri TaxID=49897 RepID=A0A502DUE4_9MYCO|nr:MerR family transcriptional regulator [Mycolicibacterium hodleri]TPG28270.1 MerR family transcriptional regulator [Mycolicibacterium hodleri]
MGALHRKVTSTRNEAELIEESPRSERGVYGISVASELSGIGQQTLRLYEQRGLLTPSRTQGGTRRYSEADLLRLRQITALIGAGVNLAGVARILVLESQNTELQADNARLQGDSNSEMADSSPD